MPKNTCKPWKGPPKKRSLTYRFLYHFRVKGSRGIVGIGLPRGDMRACIARVGRPPRYDPKSCDVGLSGCGIFHRVRFGPHSDKNGGLNGSTQHELKVHVQASTKLNSFKGVDSNKTLPCLGSDGVQPYRSVPYSKYSRINRLDGVASTG